MVRETRFSFDDGMNVDYPAQRETFDEDGLDDFIFDERPRSKLTHPSRREPKRIYPDDRRPDRRHLAGGDWQKPNPPEGEGRENRGQEIENRSAGAECSHDICRDASQSANP